MRRFPWKGIGFGCAILVLLVIGRCVVTAGRVIYYGGTNWVDKILADPWFFVGMAAAAACAACFLVAVSQIRKE